MFERAAEENQMVEVQQKQQSLIFHSYYANPGSSREKLNTVIQQEMTNNEKGLHISFITVKSKFRKLLACVL